MFALVIYVFWKELANSTLHCAKLVWAMRSVYFIAEVEKYTHNILYLDLSTLFIIRWELLE